MARRGKRRRDPEEPPWWFNLLLYLAVAAALLPGAWLAGACARILWRWALRGWGWAE